MILFAGLALAVDTLWYTGHGGDAYARVEGLPAAVGALETTDTWPTDLTGYRLVFLATPTASFDSATVSSLRAWVDDGGVLVLVGEFPDFAPGSDDALNTLSTDLGLDAALRGEELDCSGTWSASPGASSLAVGSPGYSCSNALSGDTAEVIYSGVSGQVLGLWEDGVVLLADSNLVVDDVPFGADNAAFVEALYLASCAGLGDRDGDGDDAAICGGADCDDGDPAVGPGAAEVCDGRDQDCDGTVDEDPTDGPTWFADVDADGAGDAASTEVACAAPSGFVASDGDCDDTSALIRPGADEHCDGVDEDCDAEADEDAIDPVTWFSDADGDGLGDSTLVFVSCSAPASTSATAGDCDDTRGDVYPGAVERCDEVDQDCDGVVDDLAADATTWSSDYDHDGYGGGDFLVSQCDAPEGYADNTLDCDDHDSAVFPGADERCDEVDNDCDTTVDEDAVDADAWYADTDDDGWGDPAQVTWACSRLTDTTTEVGDCDDTDRTVNPDAEEACDGVDQDCDAVADDGLPTLTWYLDADGDGVGADDSLASGCEMPEGAVEVGGDCDDADPTRTTDCATAEDTGESPAKAPTEGEGCGCQATPPRALLGLGGMGLFVRRRRRRAHLPEQ